MWHPSPRRCWVAGPAFSGAQFRHPASSKLPLGQSRWIGDCQGGIALLAGPFALQCTSAYLSMACYQPPIHPLIPAAQVGLQVDRADGPPELPRQDHGLRPPVDQLRDRVQHRRLRRPRLPGRCPGRVSFMPLPFFGCVASVPVCTRPLLNLRGSASFPYQGDRPAGHQVRAAV